MTTNKTGQDKIEKPHAHFETPHEVAADPALSKQEKGEALDSLEQDARLLATASAEGMTGGEPSNLHEVLDAKDTLEHSPTANAYELVLRDLMSRQAAGPQGGTKALIENAIEALKALGHGTAARGSSAAGIPPQGSDAEVAKEIALEKLDP
ncbi:MAG: hypothetical protein M3Y22_00455 [Pseudomonadota bacterium]|nr:hypothetical protein [Pseudomonadota bacterium]